MPDWLVPIVTALIGGLFGAGGFAGIAQLLKARSDARLAFEAQQDEHTLKLHQSLYASEEVFRNAVLGAYDREVKARREIEARLDAEVKARSELEANYRETQKQLTVITLQRDDLQRQYDRALERIRHLEAEVAQLRSQNQKEHN